MKPISSLKVQQLCLFSKPKCDRAIYRAIKQHRLRTIVEVGLGDTTRTKNMLRLAQKYNPECQVRYTGIDLFDARPNSEPGLELIKVHKELAQFGAKVQLVPGTIDQAICRIANSHMRTDLIVISSGYTKDQLNSCWSFLPRMLCATSTLMLQPVDEIDGTFQVLTRMEIERIARRNLQRTNQVGDTAAA